VERPAGHALTRPATSIRRRVLRAITALMLAVVAAAAALAWAVGMLAATDAYDRALLDPAIALAGSVRGGPDDRRLDLSEDARRALMVDEADTLAFQVLDARSRLVAGDADLPAPPEGADPASTRYFDATWRGTPVRVAQYRTPDGVTVRVGETLHKRERLLREVLLAALAPALIAAIAAILLVRAAVAHALAPLDRVRDELSARSPTDLDPLPADEAPDELRPAVLALNGLLERLRKAAEAQQRFIADAAHQLRTPLAGLRMQLDLLQRHPHPPDVAVELDKMHAATTRASRLAHQLLALARVERDGERRRVDLYRLGDAAARDWTARAIERDVDLGFELDHAEVMGDEVMLSELLGNLIDNAIRYSPPGSVVTVRCGVRDGAPTLTVEDDGPGIPDEARASVLERFYRVAGTTGEGSGLGLAIVREVAERHGARVEVGRPATGRGTSVTVRFDATAA
jgi:two-component system sensor histidine kinase TctE